MAETGRSELVVQAPAKINLTLHIVGKREDGYHDLDTVMQKIDLVDTITLCRVERPGITLVCSGNQVLAEDSSNLAWKAASAFLAATGKAGDCGIAMTLEKRIPVAAGLGGGSSDAGAVLTGLNRLLHTGLSQEELIDLARPLGADVPFFVVAHHAVRATGIGDRMVPVSPLSDCSLLLVNPGFSVSTAWAYQNFTLTRASKDSNLCDSRKNDSSDGSPYPLYNDLEMVTIQRYPELSAIKRFLLDGGASDVLMSGSGPTLFGIFPDVPTERQVMLNRCADELRRKFGQGVFVTRPAGA